MRKTGILRSLRSQGFDTSRVIPFERGARASCSQCEALCINGIATHEHGCPNKPIECRYCGDTVLRSEHESCSCFLESE